MYDYDVMSQVWVVAEETLLAWLFFSEKKFKVLLFYSLVRKVHYPTSCTKL